MLNCRQVRRKGHVKIFPGRIGHKMLALPEKIVMVCNRRQLGFGNGFGESQAQGDMQGYRQRIFCNQQINFELLDKFMEFELEV